MKAYKYLIVVFAIIGLLFIGTGTVSYFIRNIDGTVNATTDSLVLNVTGFDDEVNKVINFGQIAPGSEGKFTLNLNMTGSATDVIYSVDIERTNLPDNLKFYYDNVHISPFVNCSKFIAYSASSMNDTVVIYWYWDGEVDDANDTLFIDKDISASVSVNVESQIYGTMKNGHRVNVEAANRTEFWNDAYRPYIRTMEFKMGIAEVPSTCNVENLCWDISDSATQEYHVYAYLIDSGFKNTISDYTIDAPLYNLYIACEREIYAPNDCGNLFFDMKNLISIKFNDNFNTSRVTKMYSFLTFNSNLIDLDLSGFITSNVVNIMNMFTQCSSLTNLDLSNFNTNNVTDMRYAFSICSNLTSLDLSSFNTSNVNYMSEMFRYCSKLTSLDLSNFNTKNVTEMYGMFESCHDLSTLGLSNFNTSNVTDMSSMFGFCSGLTGLDVSVFNTKNVKNMTRMFQACSSLISLDLSLFNTISVTNMSIMFGSCTNLISLNISSFNTSNVTNMGSMFSGCSNLTNLNLNSFDFSNVIGTAGGSDGIYFMFERCSKLSTTINMNGVDIVNYMYVFRNAATDASALITVNYTNDTSTLVDNMILTKSYNSHVVKGTLIS